MNPKLLLLEELCSILNISRSTAYRLLQSGQLPAQKIGAKWQVRSEDLENFIHNKFQQ